MKIQHLGKIHMEGDTVVKEYMNSSAGSAYKKIPCDIMLMANAGHKRIKIRLCHDYPYKDHAKQLVSMTQRLLPYVLVTLTEKKK